MAKRNITKPRVRPKTAKRQVKVKLKNRSFSYSSNDPTWDESALKAGNSRWKKAVEGAKINSQRKTIVGKNPIKNYKKLARADLRTPEHVARMAKIHSATTLGTEAIGSLAGNYAASKAQDTQVALLKGGSSVPSYYEDGANKEDEEESSPSNPYGNTSHR